MIRKSYFYINDSDNPHETLALEEYMLEHIRPGEIILYLYTHKNSVIIGKNQNAWVECRHELLQNEQGTLARRISGGGAVFHDTGNLNFSFVTDKNEYDLKRQLSVILSAVQAFGIQAEFSGRNDILADGKKFSGNAFCHRKNGSFHHGTILINVDKANLTRYLQVSGEKIESKGIASVRARICNLTDFNSEITNEKMTAELIRSFSAEYGRPKEYIYTKVARAQVEKIAVRNAQWEWLFGNTPRFDITIEELFNWGGVQICIALRDAVTQNVKIYSDAMDTDFIEIVSAALTGRRFRSADLVQAVLCLQANNGMQEQMLRDVAGMLRKKEF